MNNFDDVIAYLKENYYSIFSKLNIAAFIIFVAIGKYVYFLFYSLIELSVRLFLKPKMANEHHRNLIGIFIACTVIYRIFRAYLH